MRRPSWMPRRVWWSDRWDAWLDRTLGWFDCHVRHKHEVRFGTAPYCIRCGRLPR